jgi:ribosomal protein S27AE
MPDRPFEAVPSLPWQPEHKKDRCDDCGNETYHLFFLEHTRRWVCVICKTAKGGVIRLREQA